MKMPPENRIFAYSQDCGRKYSILWRRSVSFSDSSDCILLRCFMLLSLYHLDGDDAALVHLHNLEGEVAICDALVERGELALDFK